MIEAEETKEYREFVDKFKPKKTTDDCYTPEYIYNTVCQWVENEYSVKRDQFVRPFWPGADYTTYPYQNDDIVVDNPPFSIFSQIVSFYIEHGIKFFLFAPALTIFNAIYRGGATALCICVDVIYQNGANIKTSFVTNLGADDVIARSAPTLDKAIKKAIVAHKKETAKPLPKYDYPDNVITASMINQISKYNVEFELKRDACVFIRGLDSQKEKRKGIFGGGFLLSEKAAAEKAAAEKAAAERAAAEKWSLSEREKKIIENLK